ncbi:hypothetical protein AVEN_102238-1 [Araneus ventricosus]|uniref:Uncharacterized protein n=1 Tax=Araneus ventricosus TaxID=182803 RepID=A0A4Y2MCM9_ARAVE|nr:hypothetical protein AVEN_102238-1 [Araneus ventricosus]
MILCRSNSTTGPFSPSLHSSLAEAPIQSIECDWFMTTGERQFQFQWRYHLGRSLTLPLCLLVLAGNSGVAFTPWVALPGENTSDVHHPLLPGTPPCRVEATNRSTLYFCIEMYGNK